MTEFQVQTHDIETPVGKQKVVLKNFISGYDDEAIERIYTRGRHKISVPDANNPESKGDGLEIDGSAIQDAEREGVSRVVVSVDGVTENVLDLVYNMRKEDTRFVKAEVDKVINPSEDKPAKKSSGSKSTPAS